MNLPKGCSLSVSNIMHSARFRPLSYLKLELKSAALDFSISRYVFAGPLLLRLRLWVALRKLARSHDKILKALS